MPSPRLLRCGASGSRHSLPRTAGAQPGKSGQPAVQYPSSVASAGQYSGAGFIPPCRRRMNRDGDLIDPASLPEPRASRFAAGNRLRGVGAGGPHPVTDAQEWPAATLAPAAALRNTAGSGRGACRRVRGWRRRSVWRLPESARNIRRRDRRIREMAPYLRSRRKTTPAIFSHPIRFRRVHGGRPGDPAHRIRPSDSPGIRRRDTRNAPPAPSVGTHTARRRSQRPAPRNIPATSTATPSGSEPMPTAARACLPASPNTSIIKSEAPFITCA